MTEQQSQSRPAPHYSEQQVYHSRWKIGNRDSEGESFRIEYIVAAFKRYKTYGFSYVFVSNARRWTACVQQKFESVYLHVIKKHRNNLLFSYYELTEISLSLIYFRTASILFDLKNLNLSKRFERLTGRFHCLPVIHLIWPEKCLKFMLFTLPDQTAAAS